MNRKLLVGIVDDDSIFQFTMNVMIRSMSSDVSISSFRNGMEAIIHLKDNIHEEHRIPDLLLLDINMPVMDGWQFLDELELVKGQLTKIPTIYLISSSEWPGDRSKARTYPVVKEFKSKPIFEIDLRNIFQNAFTGMHASGQ